MHPLTIETMQSNLLTSPPGPTDSPEIILNKIQLNSETDSRNQNPLNRRRCTSFAGDTINFNCCFVDSMNNNGNSNINSVNSNNTSKSHRNIPRPNPNQQKPNPRKSVFGRSGADFGSHQVDNEFQIQSMKKFINAPVSADVKAQKLVEIFQSRNSTPRFDLVCSSDSSFQSKNTISPPKEQIQENTWTA
jgi:hypothetical protein